MGDIVKLSGEEKEEIVLTRSSVLISYIISGNLFCESFRFCTYRPGL